MQNNQIEETNYLCNMAYERSILSSLIYHPEILDDVMDRLKPKHLYLVAHREIYEAIIDLKRKDYPIDEEFIRQELVKKKTFNERVMVEVLTANPISSIDAYIAQVIEYFRLQQIHHIGIALRSSVADGKDSDTIIGEMESFISNIDEGEEDLGKSFYELYQEFKVSPPAPTFKSGISFMDEGVGGAFKVGHLVTVSGDPEAGKTILMLQMQKGLTYSVPTVMFAFEFTTQALIEMQIKSDPKWANNEEASRNLILIDNGFDISDIERKIKKYVRKGVLVFTIDSQMRIENAHFNGFTMEERETEKFSRLAKLAHRLKILIFLIIQTTDTAPDRPLGSKKGAHEASVMIRLKREKPKDNDEHKERRKFIIHKNKMSGQHFEKDIILNPFTLNFTRPYGEGGVESRTYNGHKKGNIPVEHQDASGNKTGQSAMEIIEGQLKEVAGDKSGQLSMPMI